MKTLFALLCAGAMGCTVQAQNTMGDMPGMTMPSSPQQQPAPKPQASHPRQPNKTPLPVDPQAPDVKSMGQNRGDPKAKSAAASEENSVQQQAAQADKKPGARSDATSITVPVQTMQEPEAEGFRTGGDLPAPELLGDVGKREPMRVEEFIGLAEANNPTLAQAQRNVDRSREQARQAGLPPDPTLGYSGDHIRGGEYHGGEEGAFFSQVFVLGRKLVLRRDVYRAEGRANEYAVEVQRARVRNDVGSAFIDALAAQQTVDLEDRLLKVALDAQLNAHELQRVGQADASAVLMAEIAAEQAKVDFSHAQREFLASYGKLATMAGKAGMEVHPLEGALVEPPQMEAQMLAASDGESSPVVKQAQAGVEVAKAQLRDARREAVPNLNVTAGEWYSGEELDRVQNKAGWESFVQAGVQIPLWNRNQGNVAAARALVARADGEVSRARLWTRNRAEPLAQQYAQSRFAAERYRTEMIPRARRAYQLEVMKYQQMAQVYPAVLTAQRMLFTLQVSYVEALHEEWRAAIALQNFTLTDGLEGPPSAGSESTTLNLPTE